MSPGYAIGKALVLEELELAIDRTTIPVNKVKAEKLRLKEALAESKKQLYEIKNQAKEKVGEKEAAVFEAHILILEDPEFIGKINHHIEERKVPAPAAVDDIVQEYVDMFSALDNEYMKERVADIIDLKKRVIANIIGVKLNPLKNLEEAVIVVAHDLAPSDTAQMNPEIVLGFVTETGGRNSHTAIMARSQGIPAVVGVPEVRLRVSSGDNIIMDGETGIIIINPEPQDKKAFRIKVQEYNKHMEELLHLRGLPAETKDKQRLELAANIGSPADIPIAKKYGAEGVGLFRTEFLYMDRNEQPSEEEQFETFKEVAQAFDQKPVIIRTLDIGGDKNIPCIDTPLEVNPFLGWRAIRFCLDHRLLFKTQLKAILKASHYGNIKIMYPMITGIEDLQEVNGVLIEVKKELQEQGIPFDENIEVGVMIEIPSAAITADRLAWEVDFFSIGTNDLIQYTLAVDRLNENVSRYYRPFHPSVLRLIKMTVQAATQSGIWVGMCGEMAGDPEATELLVGLGIQELSMSPTSILKVKEKVRRTYYKDCIRLAEGKIETYDPI